MKTLLLLLLAVGAYGQTKVGALDGVAQSAPSAPSAGYRYYSKTGTGWCQKDSGGTETCIGTGSGATAVSGLTDVRVTKSSSTVINIAAGNQRCGSTNYAVSSTDVTISAGSATTLIGYNCLAAGTSNALVVARGANTVTGSGFNSDSATDLSAYGTNINPIASVTASSGTWGTVTDNRTINGTGGVVASTGITIDADSNGLPRIATDSTVRRGTVIWLPAAACAGTTGTLSWDTLASLAPTATCSAGGTETTLMRGVADFPDSDGEYSMQIAIALPSSWSGTMTSKLKWRAAATSGNVVWQQATVCRADAEVDDAAFNTADTVTDAAKGTANQLNDATISSATVTGCAAGEIMHIKVFRQRTHASDTITGTISLAGVEVTLI